MSMNVFNLLYSACRVAIPIVSAINRGEYRSRTDDLLRARQAL